MDGNLTKPWYRKVLSGEVINLKMSKFLRKTFNFQILDQFNLTLFFIFIVIRKRQPNMYGLVTKLKNLSDVHSILQGAVENDFQLVIQKESYESASDL